MGFCLLLGAECARGASATGAKRGGMRSIGIRAFSLPTSNRGERVGGLGSPSSVPNDRV